MKFPATTDSDQYRIPPREAIATNRTQYQAKMHQNHENTYFFILTSFRTNIRQVARLLKNQFHLTARDPVVRANLHQ